MSEVSTADRVRRLIDESGLNQADFAEQVGLDGPKLSKSLAGTRRFTSLDLARIAEYCHTTVDDLLGVSTQSPALAARASHAVGSDAVDIALTEAKRYASARQDLAFLYANQPLEPMGAGLSRGGMLIEQGARLATQALARLESPSEVLTRDLAGVIEKHFAVDVAIVKLVAGFDGLAWLDSHTRLIVVGASRVPGRQRFTMAHELGHLFAEDQQDLHVDEDVSDKTRRRDPSEMRANAFAAAFLMPESLLRERVSSGLTDQAFAQLSCELSVSPSSLAWRLLSLDLIDQVQQRRVGGMSALEAAQLAGQTASFAEWVDASSKPRPPARLLSDMLRAYLDGKATLRPFANLIDVPVDLLESALASVEDVGAPPQ